MSTYVVVDFALFILASIFTTIAAAAVDPVCPATVTVIQEKYLVGHNKKVVGSLERNLALQTKQIKTEHDFFLWVVDLQQPRP